MRRRPPRSTRTDTLFPYTTLFRSAVKSFKTLDDMGEISGKAVLVREDLNVPMKDDLVTDDTRLRAAVPTVNELSDRGAKVLILAHFGRPKGLVNPDMSLAQTVSALSSVLGRPVRLEEHTSELQSLMRN